MSDKPENQKDLLFSKLLPALNDNPFSTLNQGSPPPRPVPVPEPPAKKTELALDNDDDDDDIVGMLRNRLFARDNVSQDCYSTVNIIESMVFKHLDEVTKRFNTCSCDRCKCDIAAHALNNLAPKYIVAEPKKALVVEEKIDSKDIIKSLVNAVIQVRANPRH